MRRSLGPFLEEVVTNPFTYQNYSIYRTIATAVIPTTFFVVTKDEFERLLEQRGEFFGIAVGGNQDDRCSISTAQGYKGSCAFTKSGTYRIEIRFAGQVIIVDIRTRFQS
jgi:hypothetical protein